jgi:hypothetical protein
LIHIPEEIGDGVKKLVINKPHRTMKNSILSKKLALLIATMLPAIMLAAASPMLSSAPTTAYAQEIDEQSAETGANINDEGEGIAVSPVVQVPVQVGTNVNVDDDIVVDLCDDGSVEAVDNREDTLANVQSTDQGANINNDVDELGTAVSPVVQLALQFGTNMNLDSDVIVALDCGGEDIEVADDDSQQANVQSAEQQGDADNEAGTGDVAVDVIEQVSRQEGLNLNDDIDTTIIR